MLRFWMIRRGLWGGGVLGFGDGWGEGEGGWGIVMDSRHAS